MADVGKRDGWSARTAFISAAVGSAVGLGNVWRFPSLVFTYGGGAFLLPFILGVVFIGIPILILEFALGQVCRSGDVHSFGSINKRLGGVGVGSVFCGFMVTCYYVVIIGWAVVYFINAFGTSTGADGESAFLWETYNDTGGTGPGGFLMGNVIQVADMTHESGNINRSMKLVHGTVWAVTIIWILIFLSLFKGPKTTGRITYFTNGFPIFLLIVLCICFGSMDGASAGVSNYFQGDINGIAGEALTCGATPGKPDSGRPCRDAWPDAVAQVFFSLGVTFGVMTAYASYNPPNQGIVANALAVAFSDVFVSIIGAFAVFTAIGFLATSKGNKLCPPIGGEPGCEGPGATFGLVFISYPGAIAGLKTTGVSFAWRKLLAILWFLTISLLGVDSAFSLVEGFATSFKDSRLFKNWSREGLTFAVCLVGYLIGMEYTVDTGLYSLDAVDYYINISMLFIGFMECVCAGWLYKYEEHIEKIGSKAWWASTCSMILASYYGPRFGLGYGGGRGTACGFILSLVIFGIGQLFAVKQAAWHQGKSVDKQVMYDVLIFNVEELRKMFNDAAGKAHGNIDIPFVWSLCIKFLIPPVLMLLLIMKFMSTAFGAYENYPAWYQGWGIFVAAVPWAATIVNWFLPDIFDQLRPEAENAPCEKQEMSPKHDNQIGSEAPSGSADL